jgi:hypothetical protein
MGYDFGLFILLQTINIIIMKLFICLFSTLLFQFQGFSQNWNEWFRQRRTQIRYHLRQIAALQIYIELGQKGYGIYKDGLDIIGDIKDGDFNLHKDYFASLSDVNPRIGQSPHVDEIILWHEQVMIFQSRINKMQLGVTQGSLDNLFKQLVNKSNDHRDQLALLITDRNYQLKDEERIDRINQVYLDQKQLYEFAKSTYQEAVVYDKQRHQEEQEIKVIKQLQGLP